MSTDHLDKVTRLLSYLVCADSKEADSGYGSWVAPNPVADYDAGVRLRFDPIEPALAYTVQLDDDNDRLFALNPKLLLQTPQDLIGSRAEIAFIHGDCVKWSAFKKIYKRPHSVWVASAGADLYEYHYRVIYPDGKSSYTKRVAAISKTGAPVRTVVEGAHNFGGGRYASTPDGQFLVLAASVIEDSLRPGAFQATVKESTGLIFPVPQGEHLEVFRLRDGPMIGSRRKALLHWVAKHTRRTKPDKTVNVKQHLRGVHQFEIDGFEVTLTSKE